MGEADWLGPLFTGRLFETLGQLFGAGATQRRLERMGRAPPHFRGQTIGRVADRFHGGGEQQRFADRGDLRLVTLLRGLGPKGFEIRRDHHTGQDLVVGFLERGDLCAEILRQILVAPRIVKLVALRGERFGEADIGITPGVAVAVVREQSANLFVGRHLAPHIGEHGDDVFQTPKEMIGPIESHIGLTAAAEEPRLPRTYGGNAGNLIQLRLIGNRVSRLRRATG